MRRPMADVVVVCWNQRELTLRCLEHLSAQTVPCRVILVDNASVDGTPAAVRERFPHVDVLENGSNLGFGRAVNRGAAVGDADALVLVNNDLFVDVDFVGAILAPLAKPGIGMVAGLTLMPGDPPSTIDSVGMRIDRSLCVFTHGRHAPAADVLSLAPTAPNGGCAAYRRSAFEAVGGFDELLFAYGEDADLGLRIAANGWYGAFAATARGVHLGGASTAASSSSFKRRLSGNARGFLLRRYRLGIRGAARAVVTEALVVLAEVMWTRSVAGLGGRIAGWRRAATRGERLPIPSGMVDSSLGLFESLRLRAGS